MSGLLMVKSKLIDSINNYYDNVMSEIKKIPLADKDALRGITYTENQVAESKKEKEQFLRRFSDFIPKAEKILDENKNEFVKKFKAWQETQSPPKTTTKAKLLLVAAVISSVVAALLPVIAVLLETMNFNGATWVAAASIPEIFGGTYLISRYDTMKANINNDYNNWQAKGDELEAKIQTIDRTIDRLYVLKYRIEFYVNDDNIMSNEWTFQSIQKEAEMLMESILNV
jgi:hypothetical protein